MKKIFSIMALSFMTTALFAQWQDNGRGPNYSNNQDNRNNGYNNVSLIISNTTQNMLYVVVDNSYNYQATGTNGYGSTVNINSLNPGYHNLAVYETKRNFFGKQKQVLIYSAGVNLHGGFETTVQVNKYGQATVNERPLYGGNNNGNNNGNGNCNNNNSNGGYGNKGNGEGNGYGRRNHRHDGDRWDWRSDNNN